MLQPSLEPPSYHSSPAPEGDPLHSAGAKFVCIMCMCCTCEQAKPTDSRSLSKLLLVTATANPLCAMWLLATEITISLIVGELLVMLHWKVCHLHCSWARSDDMHVGTAKRIAPTYLCVCVCVSVCSCLCLCLRLYVCVCVCLLVSCVSLSTI